MLNKAVAVRPRKSIMTPKILVLALLWLGAAVMMFPFLWALSVSLQGPGLTYVNPPRFFMPPYMFSNYVKVFMEANFMQYALNSLFIAGVCIIGNLFANSFIGFGFAKYSFKGSELLFFTVLSTMMLPHNITSIAHYIMWRTFGALDTYIPLTLPAFFGSAVNVFLMRQCFKGIPNELYEAAIVDGAKPPRIFYKVYLPLAKPMLATLVVTTFMSCWNNMFGPLIYITTKSRYTISIGLLYIRGHYEHNMELMMAASVMAMLPVVIVYFFAQKHFVKGLVSAGIKG